ncbi:MAG TPA: ATP-binding protein [Candidatus Krumholzibacteria bacterium]|nr:ATP-binding protein [Candidatus Krumholzibacteria bacterium]
MTAPAALHAPDPTRRWVLWGLLLYAAVLAAVAVGMGRLTAGARERLDRELGARLAAVAAVTARLVDGDLVAGWRAAPWADPELDRLDDELAAVLQEQGLSEITLTHIDGTVLASAARRQERGESNTYWALDRSAVGEAKSGATAAGGLVPLGDGYQKSAHAPVRDVLGEVTAVVSVEAEADYFDALAELRRGAWLTGLAVAAVLVVIGIALSSLLRDMVRTRARLAEQEKLAAMGRMTAGIAHEIRNPLGIIRGAGELIGMRLEKAGLDPESADFITGEVDRLDRILSRYLTFGRGGGLNPEPLDLAATVRRTLRNLAGELGDLEVTVEVRGEPRPVPADDPALQQVLLNLLLNARDAGGPLTVGIAYGATEAALSVADRGPGLEGRDPESLFTPFHTTKEKGSGLGLAVVRQVARDHGGDVRLEDRPDGPGAVATLTLPYAGPAAEE